MLESAHMTGTERDSAPLLEVDGLVKHFPARDGPGQVQAVNGVSLRLDRGETLGIVGESGCGKSTLARLILRLIEPTKGRIRFDGEDLRALPRAALRLKRREMQIIFQDPYASLDPRFTVGAIIGEPLAIHGIGNRAQRQAFMDAGGDPDKSGELIAWLHTHQRVLGQVFSGRWIDIGSPDEYARAQAEFGA